jgi:hypothetical protein
VINLLQVYHNKGNFPTLNMGAEKITFNEFHKYSGNTGAKVFVFYHHWLKSVFLKCLLARWSSSRKVVLSFSFII